MMATLTVPYSFNTNTAIIASEMNSNFGAVKTFVEGLSTGANIDAGAIDSTKLATAAVQLLTPTGSIVQYGGSTAPTGWLLCDGTAYSQTTYAALFAVVGSTYNTSGGQSAPSAGTFRVPLLTGRVPVGKAAAGTFATLGATGGAETHSLTSAESGVPAHQHPNTATFSGNAGTTGDDSPDHSHQYTIPNWNANVGAATSNIVATTTPYATTVNTGGRSVVHQHSFTPSGSVTVTNVNNTAANAASAHNNLQPYIVVNYIIKI